MWIYWAQSVIIGAFNVVRMWTLENFSTDGLKMNDQPVDPTTATKRYIAIFFMFHYGFFHLVYAIFLIVMAKVSPQDIVPILICVAGFFVNHWFSYRYNKENDQQAEGQFGNPDVLPVRADHPASHHDHHGIAALEEHVGAGSVPLAEDRGRPDHARGGASLVWKSRRVARRLFFRKRRHEPGVECGGSHQVLDLDLLVREMRELLVAGAEARASGCRTCPRWRCRSC